MFTKERLDKIVQILYSEGKVIVKDLSELFGISEDAIRKDLKHLEKMGVLERTYGGGITKKKIAQNIRINERNNYNTSAKKVIAEKAFSLIQDKDIIFLDISSTNMLLAENIIQSNKKLTILSNSIDILKILSNNDNIRLICPGGVYSQELDGFVGSATIDAISRYNVQKAFIGSIGVDVASKSVQTIDVEDGNTKRAIMKSAKEVILIMENRKFFYDGTYKFADLKEINTIVTEKDPSVEIKTKLNTLGVNLI